MDSTVSQQQWIACTNPASGVALGRVPACSAKDVDAAVERAHLAQQAWAESSFAQRRAVLEHMLEHILKHADELVDLIVEVSGKTHENALLGEVMTVCNKLRWLIKHGERHLKPEKVSSGVLMHKKGRIEYRPLGVVACIVPWNYPLQNVFGSLAAPLMAGNAVVIKPSEAVAYASPRLQQIVDQALSAHGFSSDTVQIIDGYAETGAALVQSRIQKILFIGSVANGRRIIQGSAHNLVPTVMELGGKDAFIVCDDANLEQAVHSALGGCFINLGQNCVAAERIIVQDGIHQAFVDSVLQHARQLRQGMPQARGTLDVGAMTTRAQVNIVDELVQDALQQGAQILLGGRAPNQGNGYPPTILTHVTGDMRIAREEVFGPIMLIMRVANDEQAVALANNTEFGLQSSVFSRNRKRAERIAAALQVGGSCINDYGLCYMNQDLPFGGVKHSGFGRMNGRDGLRAYCNAKAVLSDRWPLHIPPRLFPVKAGDYERARSSIHLLFARSWVSKCRALWQLITGQSKS